MGAAAHEQILREKSLAFPLLKYNTQHNRLRDVLTGAPAVISNNEDYYPTPGVSAGVVVQVLHCFARLYHLTWIVDPECLQEKAKPMCPNNYWGWLSFLQLSPVQNNAYGQFCKSCRFPVCDWNGADIVLCSSRSADKVGFVSEVSNSSIGTFKTWSAKQQQRNDLWEPCLNECFSALPSPHYRW